MRVGDVMTEEVVTARPDMTLKEVAREMAAHGVSGMPLLDEELRVVRRHFGGRSDRQGGPGRPRRTGTFYGASRTAGRRTRSAAATPTS
jgi:CBS domain-containing protein